MLSLIWAKLGTRQQNFFVNRSQYWQGLSTHTGTPSHTTSKWDNRVPDRLSLHPTDQFDDWIAAIPEFQAVEMPFKAKCDVYEGPDGKGFVLILTFLYNGIQYERSINVGPQMGREIPWSVVETV